MPSCWNPGRAALAAAVFAASPAFADAPAGAPAMVTVTTEAAPTVPEAPSGEPTPEQLAKQRAQTLVTQGIDRLQQLDYEAALDFFLGAYGEYRSPKILLNIGSTLREMGRSADAANSYQLYIEDPQTTAERIEEVKRLLLELDSQLVVARIVVAPTGVDVSIDGGPWTAVGQRLLTRLTPGIHMLRARKDGHVTAEISVNTFEGESRDIDLKLDPVAVDAPPPEPPPATDVGETVAANPNAKTDEPPPEQATAWLVTGARAERGGIADQKVVDVKEFLPSDTESQDPFYLVETRGYPRTWGATAQARLDIGDGLRGAALGVGVSVEVAKRWELDAVALFGRLPGIYLGARYRLLTGMVRPYLSVGETALWAGDEAVSGDLSLRVGARGAAGVEFRINEHLHALAEIGFEYFFNDEPLTDMKAIDPSVPVPLFAIQGRL